MEREKSEHSNEDHTNSANVKLIAEKRKLLEDTSNRVREGIRDFFEQLVNLAKTREKQLLRQVEAIHTQQLSLVQSNVQLVPSTTSFVVGPGEKVDLEERILSFGKLELSGKGELTAKDAEPYRVEEYQEGNKDHVSFDKSIKLHSPNRSDKETTKKQEFQNDEDGLICDENVVILNDDNSNSSRTSSLNSSLESESGHLEQPASLIDNRSPRVESTCSTLNFSITLIKEEEATCKDSSDFTPKKTTREANVDSRTNTDTYWTKRDANENETDAIAEESVKSINSYVETDFDRDVDSNKHEDAALDSTSIKETENQNSKGNSSEHPKQVQQWLQEILVETETEPTIHEIGQFSEISKARLYSQFPLET